MAIRRSAKELAGPKPRHSFLQGPPADSTCSLARIVDKGGIRLAVWICTEPRPRVKVKMTAHRFPRKYTRVWWPGSTSGWYDAHYYTNEFTGHLACFPGRTQYVVYPGSRRDPT